jgi:hydroxypyruvate isomerase
MTRRTVLAGGAAGLTTLAATGCGTAPKAQAHPAPADATQGRLKQSMATWCFAQFGEKWSLEKQIAVAKQLGLKSVELVPAEDLPTLRKHGLISAMVPNGMPAPPFVKGFNNPQFHSLLVQKTKDAIDAAAAHGCPNVITFTGFRYRDPEDPTSPVISEEEGLANSIDGIKKVIGYAEKKGVTICLENLNTRDDTSDFKGHPGYQGDHVDYCMRIAEGVGSDRMKVLLDLYHAQIMDGDLIRRIHQYKDLIGHVHTAGNPGRVELGEGQELRYRPIMEALVEIGYEGYVGHEFIPTRDPLAGLQEAVRICTV